MATDGMVGMEMSLENDYFQGIAERVLQVLGVGVIVLNHNNQVIKKNDVISSIQNRVSQNIEEDCPIFEKIRELADAIRISKEDAWFYQIYDEQLYRIYGLYHEEQDIVILLIDDRPAPSDYDTLLRTKQQMESVSYLAAGFAHELRNPLSIIRGFIQLSEKTYDLGKYYGSILSEIERMNKIIEDFLSLSRKAKNKTMTDPFAFFQSVIDLIRSECLLRNVELKYKLERSRKNIYIDQSMLIQVMLNLFRNAIEAFPEEQLDKLFYLEGKSKEKGYAVTVTDNGPGMGESVLRQIGKPFFTTKEDGTGIGLPLSKKIIQDHGGNLEIESAEGKGTTITFILPYTEDA